jgi:PAS domain S-box-containing protein
MAAPPPPDGPGRLARQLAEVWSQPDLSGSMRSGALLLAAATGAREGALFLITEDGIVEEAWSDGAASEVERRVRFQRAALEGPHADPRHFARSGAAVLRRAVPVSGEGAAGASLAWVCEDGPERDGAEGQAILDILVWKVVSLTEGARQRARQEQYERWFKTLDAQLRILDRERQKFAAIANQNDTCSFVTDASRTVRWHNKAIALLAGSDPHEELAGRACVDLCGRLGLLRPGEPCDACPVMRAFDSNAAIHLEIPDGPGGRELYLTALPIKGPDGRAFEVLAQIQDLTDLEVVRRAKDRLQTVISGAPIVLFALDRDGVFTLSEGKGLESLGLAPGEAVGRSAYDLYRDFPTIEAAIRRALSGETVTDTVDLGPLAYEAYFVPLRGADGAIQGVIGVATDITERRRAERALQESEEKLRHAQRLESVGSLAGGIAHDFNNLLTAMFGHLKFLRERAGASGEIHAELDLVEHAAHRAESLTRQLLAFSRKQVLQLRTVDLNGIVRGMEPMLQRLIREDVELVVRLDAARPWIHADAGQVEQVVINLVVNARDAMPRGGRVTIRTMEAEDAGHVALIVSDTGIGMDESVRARAFEPFFTTKPVGEGTGLGLSTVYGIVKQSGGDVLLASAPGEGATFTLHFPRTGAPAGETPGAARRPSLTPGHETILLVEDEPMVRELFRDVLEAAGYRVLEAKNGVEALEAAARSERPIDLLVTDVIMPGMGGGELVRRMAEIRPETKVLYVSGYTDDVLVRRGVIESGVSFLQKPFMPDELSRVVREILG